MKRFVFARFVLTLVILHANAGIFAYSMFTDSQPIHGWWPVFALWFIASVVSFADAYARWNRND